MEGATERKKNSYNQTKISPKLFSEPKIKSNTISFQSVHRLPILYLEQRKSGTGPVHAVLVTGLGEDGKINLFRQKNLSHLSFIDNNRYVFFYTFMFFVFPLLCLSMS
jgi:hypothetical protein